jgi:chitodextrinase
MMIKWFSRQMQLLMIISTVFLINSCGSSSSSNSTPSAPDTTVPTVPIYLTAVAASDTKVSLRWRASSDSVGVTAYTINRNGSFLATTATATTVYSDTTCTGNTNYRYSVAARDAAGNVSAFSSDAVTTTIVAGLGDTVAPSVPQNLTATASSPGQISLSWSASTDTVGVSGYNVYRSTSLSGNFAISATTTMRSFTDTGLTSATNYFYYVTAFDGVPNESSYGTIEHTTTQ